MIDIEEYFDTIDATGEYLTAADFGCTTREYAALKQKYDWQEFSDEFGEFTEVTGTQPTDAIQQ
jgi:hypothetical protein